MASLGQYWREHTTIYRPRNPQSSDFYRYVEDHFEAFLQCYEEQFERQYGCFRPYMQKVIYRNFDDGDLHNGFARVKCKDCGHEHLLAFSCKRRYFLAILSSEIGRGNREVTVECFIGNQ